RFTGLGGRLISVQGKGVAFSNFSSGAEEADIFNLCFIGANTQIGKGCLINTGAQIHHEVKIGDFTEVNPGAVLLGKVEVGKFCSIGANATILPKVKIGNKVTVGAGSVVMQDVPDGVTIVGVPGRIIT
uniref:DapH/DapD/GlmU-related protein n=1 Tax=uncultured Algoriphagus sp. TaxID=417365 RepID=UPI0025968C85